MNKIKQQLQVRVEAQSFSALGYDFSGSQQAVGRLCDDSRDVQLGDTFICLPRAATQARHFVEKAIQGGASSVIILGDVAGEYGVPCLRLADMAAAGRFLRRYFQTEHTPTACFGITGTDGKTSVAWMLREALARRAGVAWSSGTLGWVEDVAHQHDLGNTTPSMLTLHQLLAAADQAKVPSLVMEVSSHGIEQQRIAGLDVDAAIWTTLGHDHLQDHGGFEAYAELKARFIRDTAVKGGTVVFNQQQDGIVRRLQGIDGWAYSGQYDVTLGGSVMQWKSVVAGELQLRCGGQSVTVAHVPVGRFHAENLAAVAQLLHKHFEMTLADIADCLQGMSAPPGRMQTVENDLDAQVFIDYAHTPEGLQACLQSARALTQGRLLLVFGCGGDRDQSKRPEMGAIAGAHADKIWLTSDNPRYESPEGIMHDILQGVPQHACIRQDSERGAAIAAAVTALEAGDTLVIAGKGHEDYMDIEGKRSAWSDLACAQICLARKQSECLGCA